MPRTIAPLVLALLLAGGACARAETLPPSINRTIDRAVAQAWSNVQTQACSKIKERLEKPDALQAGVTAYGVSCTFGIPGAFTLDNSLFSKGTAGLAFAVPGNSLEFSTHSKGMPGFLDPKFRVGYDLDVVSHLSTSLAMPPIAVDDAVAKTANVKVQGGNLTGALASAFISPAINESIDLKQAFSDALAQSWRR